MKIALALLALIGLSTPALAYAERDVAWHWVQRGDYRYLMPPADCMVGTPPAYTVITLSQAAMDKRFLTDPQYVHMYGWIHHTEPGYGATLIYLAAGLPQAVRRDLLQHELAHARGCEHIGF